MSCGIKLEARRNADFRVTFTPASRNFTFSGMVPLFSVRLGDVVLLQVGPSATPNGSNFVVAGDSVVLTIEKADMALLDSAAPDTSSEVLFFDVTLTDGSGFENWLTGGPFILLGLNDVTCGGCNSTIEASLGGQCIQVSIEGGNLAAGASLTLQELNEAAARAEQAAEDAEAAAASIPGLVVNKADTDGGNIPSMNVQPFRESIGVSVPDLTALKAAKVTDSVFVGARTAIGDGYAGTFEWLSGDQYAGVFTDPLQGIWVPRDGDPTGSLGAWKRVFDGPVNVVWFGAPTGGDDASAFSAAAKIAFATDYIGGNLQSSLARPLRGYVDVPAGNYVLSTLVDTGGRDIIWRLDPAAVIANPENINGQIWRGDGRVTLQNPFGISDYATAVVASIGGAIPDKPAPVTGVITLQQLADYADRDAVALIGAAYSTSAAVNVDTASYTATTTTIANPSADALKRLRPGMVIDTKHATRCTAIVSSWVTVGSDLVITVAEWREKGGSSAVTPADGTGLYVSRTTKIWGGNFVANLSAEGDVEQAIGIETTTYNPRGDASPTIGNATNRVIGNYVYNPGPFKSQASFMGVGAAIYGYVALQPDNGFYAITPTAKAGAGFISQGYNTVLRGVNASNQLTYTLSSSGNETVVNKSVSSTVTKSWRTGGYAVAYDVLETVSGGSAVAGTGSYTLSSRFQRFSCTEMGFFGNAAIPRMTYGAPTGVGTRSTFDTEAVTLVELARHVKAMIDDLRALGLYG
jgi:hypothetical protein